MEYGKGYSLVEVQAPYGYVLNSDPVYFDVTADTATEENALTVVKVRRPNMAQKGIIKISKSGQVFSSVTETDGLYQPVYSDQGLAGAVYEVSAAEDVYTPDGTLRYAKGTVVDTVTTGTDSIATTKLLYLGKYAVQEIQAPYGMILKDEIHKVELTYAGQEVDITQTSTSFYNQRQKVQINLLKVLEQDEQFLIGMNDEILKVSFGIYAAEKMTATDGRSIPKDGLIEIVSCDENGRANFKTDLPVGSKLYVKEYNTDEHYLTSDKKYPVSFDYIGKDVAVVNISINDGESIQNDLIRGSIIGKKIDTDGFTIAGARFGLFKTDETDFTKDTALMTSKSNEIGIFGFLNVPYGNWIVRELQPAHAFVLNETSYPVAISKNQEIIEIEIENRFIVGSVQTTKVDSEYPDNKLTGAVFEIYVDVNGNKEFESNIDKLVGSMNEIKSGVYRMDELRCNGYFIYEKSAPEGFVKDDVYYYFSIKNDGELVTVENKAGVGFINKPIIGTLDLTKTDVANGKLLPNAGFRIKDTLGNTIIEGYTNKNGIAKFSLRYGKYTYEEFDAPDGYLIDTTPHTFEINENGQIIKANATNEKIVVLQLPKTGDNRHITLWLSMLGLSIGSILIAISSKSKNIKTESRGK